MAEPEVISMSFKDVLEKLCKKEIEHAVGTRLNTLSCTISEVQFTLAMMSIASICDQSKTYEQAAAAYIGLQDFMTKYIGAHFGAYKSKNEVN